MAVARLAPQYVQQQPAVAATDAEPPPPSVPAQPRGAQWWAAAACVALFLLAYAVSGLNAPSREEPPAIREAVEGLSAFALFYVMAFVVERLMEPFVSFDPLTPGRVERQRDDLLNGARRASGAAQDRLLDEAAAKQDAVDRWRANRALVVLGIATLVGALLAAYLRLYFLVAVGVGDGRVSHRMNVFVTALVIAGGTKPLHDLLTRIQKSKDDAKDPKETGGNA